ncbi:hypothetical protein ANCCAN_23516 [Ancylostoma caninum]|uniref:Uncharacterized protein n=1 Tax=Ancylostoma caninum TaxID=29170 RepID=A0A368FEU1_ANCCA|nr:hypothetical protein ANCCAN_23516 [Ancylostoma caninum]
MCGSDPNPRKSEYNSLSCVHSPSSPWRLFLHSLAPDGEFVEYEKLLELVEKHRPKEHNVETIPDLIVSSEDGKAVALIKPSTGQENRERTRAQVITELEVLLMRNPELTLDRLKTATTKQVCSILLIHYCYGYDKKCG